MLDEDRARRAPVAKNTDIARTVVTDKVRETKGRMSAKRLLPVARAAGYTGSPRNFRRLVAEVKKVFRAEQGRHQRRPAVWSPGETVVIDWGTLPGTGRHVFCAVLAWSRFRFVRCLRSVLDMRRDRFVGEFLDEVAFPVLAYPFGEQAVEGGVDRRIGNTADVFGLDLDDTSAITNRRLGSCATVAHRMWVLAAARLCAMGWDCRSDPWLASPVVIPFATRRPTPLIELLTVPNMLTIVAPGNSCIAGFLKAADTQRGRSEG